MTYPVADTIRRGVMPADAFRSLGGLAVPRRMLAGELPAPPIADVLPFALVEVGEGRAVFEGRPDERLYNPMGAIHGGFAMTCAVMTTLAAGEGCTTVETTVNFVRPLMLSTGPVRAEGRLVHAGARVATAEGRLVDAAGRLYAHGTSTCLRFPL